MALNSLLSSLNGSGEKLNIKARINTRLGKVEAVCQDKCSIQQDPDMSV